AAVSYASLSVVVGVMAAFALARMQFRFRDAYFKIILASMAVPGMIHFLPNYTTIDALGWTDNLVAIIVPGLASTFGIFLLRQFFISVPREIEEAAIIDGANIRQRIFYVIAPLAKESIIILWVMNFMSNWNDYLWALVVLYSPNKRTMPVGMSTLQGKYVTQYGPLMAGALFIAVPSILIFLLVQRYYIKGIDISGAVKE
ncbi:carbohydrate ABC transporter permease, partial [Mesotoga sp.]